MSSTLLGAAAIANVVISVRRPAISEEPTQSNRVRVQTKVDCDIRRCRGVLSLASISRHWANASAVHIWNLWLVSYVCVEYACLNLAASLDLDEQSILAGLRKSIREGNFSLN
jgi:hypothetical protein